MMKKITPEFIKKHISFDGTADDTCPHCKKIISYGYNWIYHKWTLAWDIAKYMGFGEAIQEKLLEILDMEEWNNIYHNKKFPYKRLANVINNKIFIRKETNDK